MLTNLLKRLISRLEAWVDALDCRKAPGAPPRSDDPIVIVLCNRTGKLWVSDAYLICGIATGKANQDQIARFGKAIRELGWELGKPEE